MKAFTFFCHGTDRFTDMESGQSNPSKDGANELVHTMFSNMLDEGSDREAFVRNRAAVIQGIGNRGHDPLMQDVEIANKDKPADQHVLRRTANSGSGIAPVVREKLHGMVGAGLDENVSLMVRIIDHLCKVGERPDAVNLVGWSRGGVTCVKFAQAMERSERLSDIPINMYVADPVPGIGNHDSGMSIFGGHKSKRYEITPNVKSYMQVVAENDRRLEFRPLKPRLDNALCQGDAATAVVRLPGHHSNVVKDNSTSGKIAHDLAYRFLRAHGTDFKKSAGRLSQQESYDLYTRLSAHMAHKGQGLMSNGVQEPGREFLSQKEGIESKVWTAARSRAGANNKIETSGNHVVSPHHSSGVVNLHHAYLISKRGWTMVPGIEDIDMSEVKPGTMGLFNKMYRGI